MKTKIDCWKYELYSAKTNKRFAFVDYRQGKTVFLIEEIKEWIKCNNPQRILYVPTSNIVFEEMIRNFSSKGIEFPGKEVEVVSAQLITGSEKDRISRGCYDLICFDNINNFNIVRKVIDNKSNVNTVIYWVTTRHDRSPEEIKTVYPDATIIKQETFKY